MFGFMLSNQLYSSQTGKITVGECKGNAEDM